MGMMSKGIFPVIYDYHRLSFIFMHFSILHQSPSHFKNRPNHAPKQSQFLQLRNHLEKHLGRATSVHQSCNDGINIFNGPLGVSLIIKNMRGKKNRFSRLIMNIPNLLAIFAGMMYNNQSTWILNNDLLRGYNAFTSGDWRHRSIMEPSAQSF